MANRLDLIVFGATSFTAKFTLPLLYKYVNNSEQILSWGIAGRSKHKLKDILVETAKRTGGDDLKSIPIILADCTNEDSILNMTAQAKLIINLCGPYQLYGEVVVKSCIATGTHYVDITAEPQFMHEMVLKYHKAAEEKGIYIVFACGVDCVPADMGILFLERNFKGTLNSVEVYLHGYEEGGLTAGPIAHYGTWDSLVRCVGNTREMYAQLKRLYTVPLPNLKPRLSLRVPFLKTSVAGDSKWAMPLPCADLEVMRRSQCYDYEHHGKRPIQTHCYIMWDSFYTLILCIFYTTMIVLFSQFEFGRKLILQYPEWFSAGLFSHKEPTEDKLNRTHFSLYLNGEGWSDKLIEADDQYTTPPNKSIVGRITSRNPGYGFTCVAVVLCAVIILKETNRLPAKGGLYTTASAFAKTSLIEQLEKSGTASFNILSVKDV